MTRFDKPGARYAGRGVDEGPAMDLEEVAFLLVVIAVGVAEGGWSSWWFEVLGLKGFEPDLRMISANFGAASVFFFHQGIIG